MSKVTAWLERKKGRPELDRLVFSDNYRPLTSAHKANGWTSTPLYTLEDARAALGDTK